MEKKPEVRFKVDVVITEETLRDYLMQAHVFQCRNHHSDIIRYGFLYLAVTSGDRWIRCSGAAYLLFGLIFLFGVPLNVWSRSRRDVRRNKSRRGRCLIFWMMRVFIMARANGMCCPGIRSITSFPPSAM